jgi:DNA-binding NarL/FixJ family response regulator
VAEFTKAPLTPRQIEVARLLATRGIGSTNLHIAKRVGITERTVKAHLNGIYQKVEVPHNGPYLKRVKLACLWNCELFQIGLKALGLVA